MDKWIVGSPPSERFPLWTRANVVEVFPDPVVPLTYDLIMIGGEAGWRDALVRMGGFAVIVDVGGTQSHAMIVSRELGIPCVPSVTNATRRIPDGATVEVDGDAGQVTILALP